MRTGHGSRCMRGVPYIFSAPTGSCCINLKSPTQEIGWRVRRRGGGDCGHQRDGRGAMSRSGRLFDRSGPSPVDAGRVNYIYSGADGGVPGVLVHPPRSRTVTSAPRWPESRMLTATGAETFSSAPAVRTRPVCWAATVHIYSGRDGVPHPIDRVARRENGGRFGTRWPPCRTRQGMGVGHRVGAPRENPGASPVDNGRAYMYSGYSACS